MQNNSLNKSILTFLILILLSHNIILAQLHFNDEQSSPVYYNENSTSKNNYSDVLYKVGIIGVSTGVMFLLDNPIRNNLKLENNTDATHLKIGNYLGVYKYHFGLAGALYLSQFVTNNKKIASTGKILLESLMVSGLASITIKYVFGRSRPNKENGNTDFNWFETNNVFNSLPSGHVISIFTTSTVLSKSIGNTYASIALYGLAGLTAYQRIASDNHWFSDVFLGASIGILVGEYFTMHNNQNESKYGEVNLIPFVSEQGTGIYIQLNL